jgi:hypothetical protein
MFELAFLLSSLRSCFFFYWFLSFMRGWSLTLTFCNWSLFFSWLSLRFF